MYDIYCNGRKPPCCNEYRERLNIFTLNISFLSFLLRFRLENLADGAVGPAAAHDEEDDGEQCCKKKDNTHYIRLIT